MPLERKLLILACGRSGTLYTSKVFKKIKVDLKHEEVGEFGSCSMYFTKPGLSYVRVNEGQETGIHGSGPRENFSFQEVWHQVREPLKTIDSLAKAFTHKVRLWTHEQLGVPLPGKSGKLQAPLEDKIHWAMAYYLLNNQDIEKQASWRFRVEDFPWGEILSRLGLPDAPLPSVPSTTNRPLRFAFRTKEQASKLVEEMYDTTWERLAEINEGLTEELREMAEGYGYPSEGPQPDGEGI